MPTPSRATVDARTGRISITERAPGDGTVLRSSALQDERHSGPWQPELNSPISWKQVVFLLTDHLGLTSDPHFTDNLLFQLLEAPR